MGWWSDDIMGGDSPLDWKADICDVMKGKNSFSKYGDDDLFTGKMIQENLDKILKKIAKGYDEEERQIGLQVLGCMVLSSGAKIPAKVRNQIIKAAEEDIWMKENLENRGRAKKIKEFIKDMKTVKSR